MKRLGAFISMVLVGAAIFAPSAYAGEWSRCGHSLTASGIGCPAALRFAHEYLDDYYYVAPIPKTTPGRFDCSWAMLGVGRFDHLSCARIEDGVRQRMRFFFDGKHLGGPHAYWTSCGIRSRVHGPSCAEARQIALEFRSQFGQPGRAAHVVGEDDSYYCTVRSAGVRYGPIYCVREVGVAHRSTYTEWKILFSFAELDRR